MQIATPSRTGNKQNKTVMNTTANSLVLLKARSRNAVRINVIKTINDSLRLAKGGCELQAGVML